jgi:hypothetical protein
MGDSPPTVQRTLVKSPPELWADLSNPESLARRLGEFGEIRITRLVPERTVAWEGERASGTVEIEPSGWGTKVRLSAQPTAPAIEEDMTTQDDSERDLAVEAALRAELEREAEIEAALLAEVQREAEIEAALRAEAEAEAEAEADRVREAELTRQIAADADRGRAAADETARAVDAQAEAPRGFFARLLRRRRTEAVASPTPAVADPQAGPTQASSRTSSPAEIVAPPPAPPTTASRPRPPATHRPPVRLSALAFAPAQRSGHPPALSTTDADFDKPGAETIAASRREPSRAPSKPTLDDEQTLAVLAGVLDDLGAAHHRPFSRE